MLRLLTPHGEHVSLEPPTDLKGEHRIRIGRGLHGVPEKETYISHAAADIIVRPPAADSMDQRPLVFIKNLGRNPLTMMVTDPETRETIMKRVGRSSEEEWSVRSVLYLLHTDTRPMQYPFTLEEVPPSSPTTVTDVQATQDMEEDEKYGEQQQEKLEEEKVTKKVGQSKKRPLSPVPPTDTTIPEQHPPSTAAATTPSTDTPAVAAPKTESHAPDSSAASAAAHVAPSTKESIATAAEPHPPGTSASTVMAAEPRPKRARIEIKRPLPSPMTKSSSRPPATPHFLHSYAVYVVPEGIGDRQLSILHTNIASRGGVVLGRVPRRAYHTGPGAIIPKQESRGKRTKKTAGAQSTLTPIQPEDANSNEKQTIIIIVGPSIRTKKELVETLERRRRSEIAATEKENQSLQHLAVPIPADAAQATSPPGSPRSIASGLSSAPSSPPPATHETIRLRSTWHIQRLEWLTECFRRNQLLPFEQGRLEDATDQYPMVMNTTAAMEAPSKRTRKLEDFFATKQPSSKAARTPDFRAAARHETAKHDAAAARDVPAAAAAAAALDEEFDLDEFDEDDETSRYSDESAVSAAQPTVPTTAAGIREWNGSIASKLQETSDKYTAQPGQQFRAMAFRRAAGIVRDLPFALQDAASIKDLKGIGSSTLKEIENILQTGHSARLDKLREDPGLAVRQLLQTVHGVGPKTAEKLCEQGIRSLDDLRTKAQLSSAQRTYLQYYDDLQRKIPREEVAEFERQMRQVLSEINTQLRIVICGSYRRGKAMVGDIDGLISHPDPTWRYNPSSRPMRALLLEVIKRLHARGLLTEDLSLPGHQSSRFKSTTRSSLHTTPLWEESEMYSGIGRIAKDEKHGWGGVRRRIDLKVYSAEEFPFAVLYFTGSKPFNRAMRLYANKAYNLSLSDKALTPYEKKGKAKVASGDMIPCKNEEDIFKALGLDYIPPENRDEVPPIFNV